MPFVYLPNVDCIMVRVAKSASTSIIRSGFGVNAFELDFAMSLPDEWEDKFRFAFVRNPFDRLVSAFQMFQKHPSSVASGVDRSALTLEKVLDVVEDDSIDIYKEDYWGKLRQHAMPITHPHYRIEEVDFLGRYETLELDWRALCGLLSMDALPLGRLKDSGRVQHYSSFFDQRVRDRANEIFKEDLRMFGYDYSSDYRKVA